LTVLSPSPRCRAKGLFAGLLVVAAVGTFGSFGNANANLLGSVLGAPMPGSQGGDAQAGDGFDRLSPGQQARSMSSLVNAGLVHPQPVNANNEGDKSIVNPRLSTIVWGLAANMSQSTGSN